MSRGINKHIIVGNLGADPILKTSPDNPTVASFSVATSKSWKPKDNGEIQEHTEWHDVVLFGKSAEVAAKMLKKGHNVYVEGESRTHRWEQDGIQRNRTQLYGQTWQKLGTKNSLVFTDNKESCEAAA